MTSSGLLALLARLCPVAEDLAESSSGVAGLEQSGDRSVRGDVCRLVFQVCSATGAGEGTMSLPLSLRISFHKL